MGPMVNICGHLLDHVFSEYIQYISGNCEELDQLSAWDQLSCMSKLFCSTLATFVILRLVELD